MCCMASAAKERHAELLGDSSPHRTPASRYNLLIFYTQPGLERPVHLYPEANDLNPNSVSSFNNLVDPQPALDS